MNNWPPISLYAPIPGPIEVSGGLLFHSDQWGEAVASVERIRKNGMQSTAWMLPRDLGIFVQVVP